MEESDVLSELIGTVYDAALDASLWPAALRNIAHFVGGSSAALYAKDATSKSGNVYYEDGSHDPHYVRLYFEEYIKIDPATTGHFFAEVGEVVATGDVVTYEEFVQTRFFREWAEPQGLVDFVSAIIDKSSTTIASFGVFRHERDGRVDAETRRRMGLVVPHVRRAALIGKVVDLKTIEAAMLIEVLDAISAGMFLLDAEGRIIHANVAGHAMLAAGTMLSAVGRRLTPSDPGSDQLLRDCVAAAGGGDTALGVRGIAIPLTGGEHDRFVAHVLPLTSGRRQWTGSDRAVAALFVHRASLNTPSPPEIIARTYGLTPTELRVLLAVVEVGGAPEVAEALGVAETTVKFHLRHLFEKTDTHRQADLVKLVAGFCNPLIG